MDIVSGYVEGSAATITGPMDAGVAGIVTAGHGPGGISYLQSPARQDAIAKGVLFVSPTVRPVDNALTLDQTTVAPLGSSYGRGAPVYSPTQKLISRSAGVSGFR